MDVQIKFQVLPHEVELVEAYSVVDNNAVDKAAEEDMPEEEEPAATVTVTVCIQYQTMASALQFLKKKTCISMCSSIRFSGTLPKSSTNLKALLS
jgi:fatty acid-binding protein DegV